MNYQNSSVTKTVQNGRRYLTADIVMASLSVIIELSKY